MSETVLYIRRIATQAIDEIDEEARVIQLEIDEMRKQVATLLDKQSYLTDPVCLPENLPLDRRCLAQHLKPKPKEEPYIMDEEIDRFKIEAETTSNPAKHFLKLVYDSPSYKQRMGSKKRGNKAINWRLEDNGIFKCSSLHRANNVYEAMHKKKWNKNTNKKKYACAPDVFRCQHILKSGEHCSKHKCENSNYCTLHHKKFILNR